MHFIFPREQFNALHDCGVKGPLCSLCSLCPWPQLYLHCFPCRHCINLVIKRFKVKAGSLSTEWERAYFFCFKRRPFKVVGGHHDSLWHQSHSLKLCVGVSLKAWPLCVWPLMCICRATQIPLKSGNGERIWSDTTVSLSQVIYMVWVLSTVLI